MFCNLSLSRAYLVVSRGGLEPPPLRSYPLIKSYKNMYAVLSCCSILLFGHSYQL
jgi:hypothetical protein